MATNEFTTQDERGQHEDQQNFLGRQSIGDIHDQQEQVRMHLQAWLVDRLAEGITADEVVQLTRAHDAAHRACHGIARLIEAEHPEPAEPDQASAPRKAPTHTPAATAAASGNHRHLKPGTPVLVFYVDEWLKGQVIESGQHGYIIKPDNPSQLIDHDAEAGYLHAHHCNVHVAMSELAEATASVPVPATPAGGDRLMLRIQPGLWVKAHQPDNTESTEFLGRIESVRLEGCLVREDDGDLHFIEWRNLDPRPEAGDFEPVAEGRETLVGCRCTAYYGDSVGVEGVIVEATRHGAIVRPDDLGQLDDEDRKLGVFLSPWSDVMVQGDEIHGGGGAALVASTADPVQKRLAEIIREVEELEGEIHALVPEEDEYARNAQSAVKAINEVVAQLSDIVDNATMHINHAVGRQRGEALRRSAGLEDEPPHTMHDDDADDQARETE